MRDNQLFIETMRIENGNIANLPFHINRMRQTTLEVFHTEPVLTPVNNLVIPPGSQKCRIIYGREIKSIEFSNYHPRQIHTLQLVEASADLDYHLKYADRSQLTKLFEQRNDCDEILIIKDGLITDTSFSNIVLTDGQRFVTPTSYLLPGTMRAALLQSGAITATQIRPDDLHRYTHIALINAMLPLHTLPLIPVQNIQWPTKSSELLSTTKQ